MASPKIGSTVSVTLYADRRAYDAKAPTATVRATIISDGPPKVVGWWGATVPGRDFVLVRGVPKSIPQAWYAIQGDNGK
jgi:hypothetical protein